jgi:2-polyprenyl-3-methyl-5-hydroxy-6-metoxy-1,4-benzoquinol methylase
MAIEWDTLHLEYDPFKARIGRWIRKSPTLRRLFYYILGCMFLREKYVKRELRRITASGKVTKDIWDAGSGYGQYSWFCARLFPQANILSTDVKDEQVSDCSLFCKKMKLDRCRFEVGDLEKASYSSQFDLILSVDVMEHIVDDVAVFRNFHQALRPGGLCVIHTPSRKSDSISKDANHIDSVVAEHVREGYTPDEICRKLSDEGLKAARISFTYGANGAKAWRLLQGHPMRWLHAHRWVIPLLPFYYLIAYPIAAYWMRRDLAADNQWGGGLLVVAEKPNQN